MLGFPLENKKTNDVIANVNISIEKPKNTKTANHRKGKTYEEHMKNIGKAPEKLRKTQEKLRKIIKHLVS